MQRRSPGQNPVITEAVLTLEQHDIVSFEVVSVCRAEFVGVDEPLGPVLEPVTAGLADTTVGPNP